MNLPHDNRMCRLTAPCVLALLMFGCSGSNDSPSADLDNADTANGDDAQSSVSDDQESEIAEPTSPDSSEDTDQGDSSDSEPTPVQDDSSNEPDPVDVPDTIVAEPIVPDSVQIRFDITVPSYQSDQLRVEVDWGDINLAATWIGDEYWSATGEFPLNTQHNVSVTFYDRNGGIELAQFTDPLTRAFDTAETIQVAADDFNIDMFDTDGDGTSNLDELITGRDPLIDEAAQLPIRNVEELSYLSRMSVSRHMESRVPQARPFSAVSATNASPQGNIYEDIDIDIEGNGTLIRTSWFGGNSHQVNGIRTVNGDSVSWEGSIRARADFTHEVSISNTVTLIDENARALVEEVVGSNVGTYIATWETSSNLIGYVIGEGPFCEPVAGSVFYSFRSNRTGYSDYTRTITKELDDPYWRLSEESADGITSESFVRELIMLTSYCGASCGTYTSAEPEDKYFQCDFVDIEN